MPSRFSDEEGNTNMTKAIRYVAFLRGINVGGNKPVKMEELRRAFESSGFEDVKTVLASGNVVFATGEADSAALARRIQDELAAKVGLRSGVILRSGEEIRRLVDTDPFRDVKVTPNTRLHVTFVPADVASELTLPYESPDGVFRILSAVGRDLCSIVELSPNHGTLDLMGFLEKQLGKTVTTRTWNTITKIAKLL